MYGDFSEKIAPVLKSYETLPNRIDLSSVSEIKSIRKVTTTTTNLSNSSSALANTNITSSNNNTSNLSVSQEFNSGTSISSSSGHHNLAFALYNDKHTPVAEFYCATATQAAEWKDGFSMLLDKRFTSKETAEIFHTLTEVGVKVKLLQIAGDRVEIPHGVIEVPPVPPGLGSGFFYDTVNA